MLEKMHCLNGAVLRAFAVTTLVFGVLSNHTHAATTYYFDTNGSTSGFGITNGGNYSWDANNWTTQTNGAAPPGAWHAGGIPKFSGGSTNVTYTVTVGNDESITGIQMASAGTLIISQAPSTSGDLNLVNGFQNFLGNGSTSTLIINAPIKGSGGFEPETLSSTFYINGNNSYTGGTTFFYSSVLTYFNNGSAFGTGSITIGESTTTSYAPLLCTAAATTTIGNNWNMTEGGVDFETSPNTPLICTGTWTLGSANPNLIRNSGDATSPLTISGQMTGGGNVTFSGANASTITLSATNNNYSGTTTIGVTGNTAIALKLAAANAIASSSQVILAGGILDPDGIHQDMSSNTTLSLMAGSTIDFGAGAAEIDFKDSRDIAWTSGQILNLANWSFSHDAMRFGTTSSGLSFAQLAEIEFNGDSHSLGKAYLNAQGYLVPEPASALMLLVGVPLLTARRRRS